MLADIDNECEGLGCNRTDFIREAVKDKLEGKRQDQEVIEDIKSEPKPTVELIKEPKITIQDIPEPKARITKVSYDDGKTWDDVPELENAKVVEI